MPLVVKLSVIDIPMFFLSFFLFKKILHLQLYRIDLIIIGLGFFLFDFGFPTLWVVVCFAAPQHHFYTFAFKTL